MPRGRLLETKKKEAYALAKKKAAAYYQAKKEAWRKEPLEQKLWQLIKDKVDPLKLFAIASLTILCKNAIDLNLKLTETTIDINWLTGSPLYFAYRTFFPKGASPSDIFEAIPDWVNWVAAFGIAYIIVEHPQVISSGLGSFVKAFLG